MDDEWIYEIQIYRLTKISRRGSMGNRVIRLCFILLVGLMLLANQQQVLAQDEGSPALQQLAFFTVGGAAGGIVLGVAIWMLDPLAPSADIRLNALSGLGGGSIVGFIFGIMQLNKQAVYPYREQSIPSGYDEGRYMKPLMSRELQEYQLASEKIQSRGIPLFQVNYRF